MRLRKPALLVLLVAVVAGLVPARTTVNAQHRARLSRDLLAFKASRSHAAARVIVPGDPDAAAALSERHGVRIVRRLDHGVVVEATPSQLDELSADGESSNLSGDLPVADFMTVSNKTLAADQVRAGISGGLLGLGGIAGVTGKGVTVAVLDSGVASHKALTGRILASVSMIAGQPATDEFGHGTHVAGIIAGVGSAATGVTTAYAGGIAPGAQIVSVRVLGDDGVGYTSDVIAGIDWVIKNKLLYNKIRVINLSLGHAVTERAVDDPLCQAVARAYQAGIVVVVAAGNAGKLADGTPVLGGIASPGNSPYAITVGSLNTWGTTSRGDDTVTTYSSRGPTRYDLAVKPDLVAPGNKIISLEASGSYLAAHYPTEHVAGSATNAYFRMSGTSMSTPMITAGAALLLEASPSLNPTQIKFLLQTGSTYLPGEGLMASGAGSANLWTSRQTQANQGLLNSLLNLLLDRTGGASFRDVGTMQGRLYAGTGFHKISLLDLPGIILNPSKLLWGDLNLVGSTNPIPLLGANHIVWGDVSYWTANDHIVWGDDITSPAGQHIVWGDTDTTDDYHIVWGDSMMGSSGAY